MSSTFDDFIRVGQIGTVLSSTVTRIVSGSEVAFDLSGTSTVEIELQKPNGQVLTPLVASFVTDGIDGKITFTDTIGLFVDAGRWKIRGVANYASGSKFMGSWTGFAVDE